MLLLVYLDLSYRDMEEWLKATEKVCPALELKRVPDPATLCRAHYRAPPGMAARGGARERHALLAGITVGGTRLWLAGGAGAALAAGRRCGL